MLSPSQHERFAQDVPFDSPLMLSPSKHERRVEGFRISVTGAIN